MATASPSATEAPFATSIVPRWVRVTERPAAVSTVRLRPDAGTVPANVTTPVAGARTSAPESPPMSMPRCWPPAYGCAGSKRNGWRTGPSAGHVHAAAVGVKTSAARTAASARGRIGTTPSANGPVPVGPRLSDVRTSDHGTGGLSLLSNEITKLSQCRAVERVARGPRQARDHIGCDTPRCACGDELRDGGACLGSVGGPRAGAEHDA